MVNGWQSGYLSRISYVTKLPRWVVEESWGRGGNAGGEEESAIEVKAGGAWVIIYGCPTPTPTAITICVWCEDWKESAAV